VLLQGWTLCLLQGTKWAQKLRSILDVSLQAIVIIGSPTWTRTRDLRINSPSLYRLSYQGIDKVAILTVMDFLVNTKLR
jgi:hypothetical protein